MESLRLRGCLLLCCKLADKVWVQLKYNSIVPNAVAMEIAINTKVITVERFDFARSVAFANIAVKAATTARMSSTKGRNCILSTSSAIRDTFEDLLPKETVLERDQRTTEAV